MAEEKPIQFAEDEDVARARAFWQDNGKSIVTGVVLGLAGIVGFNYWQSYEQHQGESASLLFDQTREGVDAIAALTVGEELKENHGSTVYAAMGAFSLARIFVEEGKYDVAAAELQWVLDNSEDAGMQHIARLRLASIYLAQDRFDDVLGLLKGSGSGAFSSRYSELLGDAHAGRNDAGDLERARELYTQSLASLSQNSANAAAIQLKLDNLGAN